MEPPSAVGPGYLYSAPEKGRIRGPRPCLKTLAKTEWVDNLRAAMFDPSKLSQTSNMLTAWVFPACRQLLQ